MQATAMPETESASAKNRRTSLELFKAGASGPAAFFLMVRFPDSETANRDNHQDYSEGIQCLIRCSERRLLAKCANDRLNVITKDMEAPSDAHIRIRPTVHTQPLRHTHFEYNALPTRGRRADSLFLIRSRALQSSLDLAPNEMRSRPLPNLWP